MSEEEKELIKELERKSNLAATECEIFIERSELFTILNLIDKLQKENEFLKAPFEYANGNTLDKRYVEMNFISKDKILKILNEDKDLSEEQVLDSIELLWEEFNRLEDIEDWCATHCISKNKIIEKIKKLEDIRETLINSSGMLEISASIDTLKELLKEE